MKICAICGEKKSVVKKSFSIFNFQFKKVMENKQLWSKILNILITVLTAIATTFGVTSCIGV